MHTRTHLTIYNLPLICAVISTLFTSTFQQSDRNRYSLILTGIYLTCTMAITTLSMVLTVLVLNLHSISERPVPRWIRIVVLEYLAKLFCRCDDYSATSGSAAAASAYGDNASHRSHKRKRKRRHLHHANPMNTSIAVDSDDDSDTEHVPIIQLNGGLSAGVQQSAGGGVETTSFVFLTPPQPHDCHRQQSHRDTEALVAMETDGGGNKPDYSKDWQRLAEVVDRLFFWAFLLAIVAISLLLFHPLTKNFVYPEPNSG